MGRKVRASSAGNRELAECASQIMHRPIRKASGKEWPACAEGQVDPIEKATAPRHGDETHGPEDEQREKRESGARRHRSSRAGWWPGPSSRPLQRLRSEVAPACLHGEPGPAQVQLDRPPPSCSGEAGAKLTMILIIHGATRRWRARRRRPPSRSPSPEPPPVSSASSLIAERERSPPRRRPPRAGSPPIA